MSHLLDGLIKQKLEENENIRKQNTLNTRFNTAQDLLGTPVRQQEGFFGGEVGQNGELPAGVTQPGVIDPTTFQDLPTTQEPSGFLGGPKTAGEIAQLNNSLLAAGFDASETSNIIKPLQTDLTKREKDELRRGDFASNKDQLTAFNQIKTTFERDIKPVRAAVRQYKIATNLIGDRGGFEEMTPADDISMITSFSKMTRPGEAVMSDDVQNAMRTAGIGDMISVAFDALGGKAMSPDQREKIYAAMTSAYATIQPEYEDIRSQTQEQFLGAGFGTGVKSPVRKDLTVTPFAGGTDAGTAETPAPIVPPSGAIDEARKRGLLGRQTRRGQRGPR